MKFLRRASPGTSSCMLRVQDATGADRPGTSSFEGMIARAVAIGRHRPGPFAAAALGAARRLILLVLAASAVVCRKDSNAASSCGVDNADGTRRDQRHARDRAETGRVFLAVWFTWRPEAAGTLVGSWPDGVVCLASPTQGRRPRHRRPRQKKPPFANFRWWPAAVSKRCTRLHRPSTPETWNSDWPDASRGPWPDAGPPRATLTQPGRRTRSARRRSGRWPPGSCALRPAPRR